jgi:hypothetical protein
MSDEPPVEDKVFCNVSEGQVDEAVGSVFEILQLDPDLSDNFYSALVDWLDKNDIEVIP